MPSPYISFASFMQGHTRFNTSRLPPPAQLISITTYFKTQQSFLSFGILILATISFRLCYSSAIAILSFLFAKSQYSSLIMPSTSAHRPQRPLARSFKRVWEPIARISPPHEKLVFLDGLILGADAFSVAFRCTIMGHAATLDMAVLMRIAFTPLWWSRRFQYRINRAWPGTCRFLVAPFYF